MPRRTVTLEPRPLETGTSPLTSICRPCGFPLLRRKKASTASRAMALAEADPFWLSMRSTVSVSASRMET